MIEQLVWIGVALLGICWLCVPPEPPDGWA